MRAVLILALLAPASALAQDLLAPGCFERVYSVDHLARNPVQQVTRIALRRAASQDAAGGTLVDLAVEMRAWGEVLRATALCDPASGRTVECLIEGDAGAFRLEPGRDGALRLVVAARGVVLEGRADFAELHGDRGDDRLFLIPRAPTAACRW